MRLYILLFLGLSLSLKAQVLDDSTKQIYSAKTVKYFVFDDLKNNLNRSFNPDTLLRDFQKIFIDLQNAQNLGNKGTATYFFEPKLEKNLFTNYKNSVFSSFKRDFETLKFYNTKSPYTNLDYVQGNIGFSKINFIHTQNFSPRLNFTLDVDKYNSSKQYGTTGTEEKLVDHWDYAFYSNYSSKNEKTKLIFALIHNNHKQNEQGGIKGSATLPLDKGGLLGNYKRNYSSILAESSFNREIDNALVAYGQYALKSGIQGFAKMEAKRERYYSLDNKFNLNYENYYKNFDTTKSKVDTIHSKSIFQHFLVSGGFKGRIKGFNYSTFAKSRSYNLSNFSVADSNFSNTSLKFKSEFLIGGSLGFFLKDSSNYFTTEAELSTNLGVFNLSAVGKYKGVLINFSQNIRPQNLIFSAFSNGYINFKTESSLKQAQTYFRAELPLKLNKVWLKPIFQNTLFSNYTYINSFLKPEVATKTLTVVNIGFQVDISKNRLAYQSESFYNYSSQSSIFNVPAFYTNQDFSYTIKYAKVLDLNIGLIANYQSSRPGLLYSPLWAQFSTNDLKNIPKIGGLTLDPYLKFKVNAVKLAFRFQHVNQGLPNQGFYASPLYLFNPRSFYLRAEWPLFD